MSNTVISYVQTDIGRRRDNNEDNFVWLKNLWGKKSVCIIGAIDGVGGYEGGKEAAAMAKSHIENYLQNLSVGAPLQLLKEAIITANNAILQKRNEPGFNRMSCVLSVAILDAEKDMLYIGHVGDSRGYIYRNGELIKITKDHSAVGFKEDSGYLTEEEAMHHPNRNEISKMLGEQFIDASDSDEYLELKEHSFLAGDIVFFCSDGLTDLVTKQSIVEILENSASIQDKVQALIDKANELGGKDNITVAMAIYELQQTAKKRTYKKIIDVPIGDEVTEKDVPLKTTRKKKQWLWLLPVVFLAGYLANWTGTKKILHPRSGNRVDTLYVHDTVPLTDSFDTSDSLIQATDTIDGRLDSTRNQNVTGY